MTLSDTIALYDVHFSEARLRVLGATFLVSEDPVGWHCHLHCNSYDEVHFSEPTWIRAVLGGQFLGSEDPAGPLHSLLQL